MPLSTLAHDNMLTRLTTDAKTAGLLSTIQLSESNTANATEVTVSATTVAKEDHISLNDPGAGNRETFKVTDVNGSTLTLDHAITNVYPVNSSVGWAPKADTSLEEITDSSTRQGITWGTPDNATVDSNGAAGVAPEFTVPGGSEIGSFALFDDSGNFLGSFLTNSIEAMGAQGTYILTDASVTLQSK